MILKTTFNGALEAAEKVFLLKFVFCLFKVVQWSKNKCRKKLMSKVYKKSRADSSNSKSSGTVESQ